MFDTKQLIDLAESAELEWRWYRGRVMGCKSCFAIDTDKSSAWVVAMIIREALRQDVYETHDLCELLASAKEDSMGLDSIVYWPTVKEIELEENDE
jgi:hypothetical protein